MERDFRPISLLVHLPNLLIVSNKVPAKTVPELIDYLKVNEEGQLPVHPATALRPPFGVMFQLASGTKMTHVPFRSTSEELKRMIGGHIEVAIDSMTPAWPQAQAASGSCPCGYHAEAQPGRARYSDDR